MVEKNYIELSLGEGNFFRPPKMNMKMGFHSGGAVGSGGAGGGMIPDDKVKNYTAQEIASIDAAQKAVMYDAKKAGVEIKTLAELRGTKASNLDPYNAKLKEMDSYVRGTANARGGLGNYNVQTGGMATNIKTAGKQYQTTTKADTSQTAGLTTSKIAKSVSVKEAGRRENLSRQNLANDAKARRDGYNKVVNNPKSAAKPDSTGKSNFTKKMESYVKGTSTKAQNRVKEIQKRK